jgi:hypothetical protein
MASIVDSGAFAAMERKEGRCADMKICAVPEMGLQSAAPPVTSQSLLA